MRIFWRMLLWPLAATVVMLVGILVYVGWGHGRGVSDDWAGGLFLLLLYLGIPFLLIYLPPALLVALVAAKLQPKRALLSAFCMGLVAVFFHFLWMLCIVLFGFTFRMEDLHWPLFMLLPIYTFFSWRAFRIPANGRQYPSDIQKPYCEEDLSRLPFARWSWFRKRRALKAYEAARVQIQSTVSDMDTAREAIRDFSAQINRGLHGMEFLLSFEEQLDMADGAGNALWMLSRLPRMVALEVSYETVVQWFNQDTALPQRV